MVSTKSFKNKKKNPQQNIKIKHKHIASKSDKCLDIPAIVVRSSGYPAHTSSSKYLLIKLISLFNLRCYFFESFQILVFPL